MRCWVGDRQPSLVLGCEPTGCESSEFGFPYVRVQAKKNNIGCESSEFEFADVRETELSHPQWPTAKTYKCEGREFGFTYVRVEAKGTAIRDTYEPQNL